jgi:hypothetical protein
LLKPQLVSAQAFPVTLFVTQLGETTLLFQNTKPLFVERLPLLPARIVLLLPLPPLLRRLIAVAAVIIAALILLLALPLTVALILLHAALVFILSLLLVLNLALTLALLPNLLLLLLAL